MDRVEELVDQLLEHGWNSKPFEAMLALNTEQPEQLLDLATAVIDRYPEGGTFFDAALSHLPESDFERAIEHGWQAMDQRGATNATDAIFAHASVQFPHLLTPYLSQLFTTLPNDTSYYAHWPWRGADENERVRLRQILAGDAPTDLQQRAWHCLLHAAEISDVELLVKKYEVAGLDVPVEALLEEVAIDQRTTPPRRLTPLAPHQVTFANGFFTEKRPAWIARENHPTWAAPLPAESSEVRFGGTVPGRQCSNCNRELCYLLEVPAEATAVLNAGDPIHLATCLSCLGWETAPMFFEHDDAGLPTALAVPEDAAEPEFPASPFDRATVRVAPSQARWATQDWGLANSRENLNRIGGAPSWIQSAQYPDCPSCNERMPFIAQLDSDLTHPDSGEWLWGSGGCCYLFWCEACRISANLWQCT